MEFFQQLHMNGGTGKASYSSNSSLQKKAISIAKPMIEEAILGVFSKYSTIPMKSIAIADMGCSSGTNTLLMVSYIMDAIYNKCCESGHASPEFAVFLNDLPSNDFNNIFRSLQGFFYEQKENNGYDFGACFVAGVPGTFYGRLFPSETLHFVHSSYSLHWLSQVPPLIGQSNKGNIYLAKSSPPTVFEAYFTQFKSDFWVFLRSRSEEVVEGGRMVLTLIARKSEDPSSEECRYVLELLAIALNDMVSQGMIEEEKLNSFNVPNYYPSLQEVKSIIQNESSFTIDHLDTVQVNWDGEDGDHFVIDMVSSSNIVASGIRAVFESLLVNHFGQGIIDELFCKYRELVEDHMSRETTKYTNVVMSLTKKQKM